MALSIHPACVLPLSRVSDREGGCGVTLCCSVFGGLFGPLIDDIYIYVDSRHCVSPCRCISCSVEFSTRFRSVGFGGGVRQPRLVANVEKPANINEDLIITPNQQPESISKVLQSLVIGNGGTHISRFPTLQSRQSKGPIARQPTSIIYIARFVKTVPACQKVGRPDLFE